MPSEKNQVMVDLIEILKDILKIIKIFYMKIIKVFVVLH
jgi:hypothetical protein